MDRRDWYFKQAVSELELNGAFDAVEQALWHLITDMGLYGIASGMLGSEVTPIASLHVSVSGPGYGYDQAGERLYVPASTPAVDVSMDSSLVPTLVAGPGNERWVSVFIKFARSLSDPRVDGNSVSIEFQSNESFAFVVVQGGEAPIPVPPATTSRPMKDPSMLLLFDVRLVHGQIAVHNADIDTTRRDDSFVLAQVPVALRAGNVQSAISAMLQALNNHILGAAGVHPDTGISSAARGGAPYALAAGSVGDQLTALLAAIDATAATIANDVRAHKVERDSIAVANFGNAIAGTALPGANSLALVFWQPWSQKWIGVSKVSAPSCAAYASHDDGRTWTSESVGFGGWAHAAWADPASTNYVLFVNGMSGSGFVNQASTFDSIPGTSSVTLPSVIFPLAGGLAFIGGVDGGGTYTTVYCSGPTGGSGFGISNPLPAIWQAGTSHLLGLVSASSTAATDASGPRTVVAMCGAVAGSDVSRLLIVSSAGVFTDATPAFLTGKVISGIAYGAKDNLWGVLCTDGTNAMLYTSPDLATWTLVHTFAGLGINPGGLAVVGYQWAAQVGTGSDERVMYSGEVATLGSTAPWSTSSAALATGVFSLVSSGNQLCSYTPANYQFSKIAGAMAAGAY